MGLFLLYIIKSSICLTLFYLFYILIMRNSTFFRFNRMTLLIGTVVCILLPFFTITVSEKQSVQIPMQTLSEMLTEKAEQTSPLIVAEDLPSDRKEPIKAPSSAVATNAVNITGTLYIIGMIITSSLILSSFFRMWQLIRNADRIKKNGYWLVVLPQPVHSFNFGPYIVLSEEDYRRNSIVLVHEQMHLRYHHTILV